MILHGSRWRRRWGFSRLLKLLAAHQEDIIMFSVDIMSYQT